LNTAAGTDQAAAGFVDPLGKRQWLRVVAVVMLMLLLSSFSSFRTTVFT
jgi:hypothetical protein